MISGGLIVKKPMAVFLCALALTSFVVGQVPNNPAFTKKEASQSAGSESRTNSSHEMTAVDVETFLDGLVPLQLKHADIAGATISVVKDGKLLFTKGYGYADVQK